jgi:hypothetical protein
MVGGASRAPSLHKLLAPRAALLVIGTLFIQAQFEWIGIATRQPHLGRAARLRHSQYLFAH